MRAFIALLLTSLTAMADDLTLRGGQPTPVPGTDITLMLTHVTDQRCPADVTCVWEGLMRIEVQVYQNATLTRVILCNACPDATPDTRIGDRPVALAGLLPDTSTLAALGRVPVLSDYTATLTYP